MAPKLRAKKPNAKKSEKAKVLVLGRPGVGKTWLSIDFPDVLYVDCEGGAKRAEYQQKLEAAGAMVMGPDEGSGDFPAVLEEVQALAMSSHDFKTLVIDSYSKLFNNTIAEEEERLTAAGEKIAFGNEKKPAVKFSRRLVRWLQKLDMNVILICHEKPLWEGGEQIGHTYDGWDKLAYELDLTLRVTKTGDSRNAHVMKSRLSEFPDGSTFPWAYDEFARRYGRKTLEGDVKALKPATDEQVNEVTVLLSHAQSANSTTKLPNGWESKALEKAGVEHWAEMDADTIQKCIDYLSPNRKG